jgi:hypothetical protein
MMTDVPTINPYKPMLLTFAPNRVYGWEREIIGLLQVVTAAEPASYAIYGIRAIGKSTLLKYLKHPRGAVVRYESYIHPDFARGGLRRLVWVYINFHQFQADTHIFFVMYEALYDELDLQDLLGLFAIPEPDRRLPERKTTRALRKVLHTLDRDHGVRVVFLMDDFDVPMRVDRVGEDEDRLLRTISDEASLVLATDDPISQVLPSAMMKDSPLLGILSPQEIGLIQAEAARQLVTEPAADVGVQFYDGEVEMLVAVAGRQPYLLTVACEVYFDMRSGIEDAATVIANDDRRAHVREQLMNRLLVLPHVNNALMLMWNKLDQHHVTLQQMAQAEPAGVPGSKEAHYLATRGVAYSDSMTGSYHIFSELFTEFIRKQAQTGITANDNRERLLMQIASNLSPVDRAVFDVLIGNEGQVCSFDELLDTVWQDGEGTKRALEAAVHRLRRDIPSGHQIKNVRGRGYKYLPPSSGTP